MTDSRFYRREGPFSLAQLAEISGGTLSDAAMAERMITDVAPLYRAGSDDISFLDNRKYVQAFEACADGSITACGEISDSVRVWG